MKLALERLADHIKCCEILLRIDNTTAILYVNKMGGVRYSNYHSLSKSIWQWAEKNNIHLFALYIPSGENVIADRPSRIGTDDTEWELSDKTFGMIISKFGEPEFNLFANKSNTKCENFFSWMPDDTALKVDTFTVKWSKLNFYAFPPFNQILKILRKIKIDQATGVLVVPYWPNQPWYPFFKKLLICEPIFFNPDKKLLVSPCRSKHHPRAENMAMLAGLISGKPFQK